MAGALGGVDPAVADPHRLLDEMVEVARGRPELDRIPPAPDRREIRETFRAAGIVPLEHTLNGRRA